MFNLNFSLKFNKLTGLRLRVVALIKSFYINFQFGWIQKKQIEPLKVCFRKNYLPSSYYAQSNSVKYFREVIDFLGN